MGASDLQASPPSEGDRRLWGMYIRRHPTAQGAKSGCGAGVRLGGRGEEGIREKCGGRNQKRQRSSSHQSAQVALWIGVWSAMGEKPGRTPPTPETIVWLNLAGGLSRHCTTGGQPKPHLPLDFATAPG